MLMAAMLLLLALLTSVSALDPSLTFHYTKHPRVFRRNEVACQVCYGDSDCSSINGCTYNAAIADVIKEKDGMRIVNDELKTKIDSMMYDLILEDSLKEYSECIPLVSSYTDCTKDNICLGCKSCDCDNSGRWSCNETTKCTSITMNVDHRVLAAVMESLKGEDSASRHKRSYVDSEESSTHSIFDDLVDWIDAPKTTDVQVTNDITTASTPSKAIVTTTASIKTYASDDNNNNLAFDDILSNDNLVHFIKYSEKDLINNNRKFNDNDSYKFLQILKDIEEGRDDGVPIDNPHRNIDLLKDLKKYIKEKSYVNEPANNQPNSINAILSDFEDTDDDKEPSDVNSIASVQKRKVRSVNTTSIANQTTASSVSSSIKNLTYSEKEIQHIIDVVTVLIGNELKQINHLSCVKDSLIKLSKKYHFNSTLIDIIHNKNSNKSRKHGHWKVNMLSFYMNNLKRDVKDTLRDIYAIQKLKKLGVDSVGDSILNLKPLLFALTSYYVKHFRGYGETEHVDNYSNKSHKHSSSINTTPSESIYSVIGIDNSERKPQRRSFQTSFIHVFQIKLIKRALTRMLLMIDADMLSTSALSPLSPKVKDIFRRIVNKQYVKDFTDTHPSIRDPNFNLTNILSKLTENWHNLPEIYKLHPADQLNNMKLLHLSVSQGIDKINDALISVQFGYSRRMTFIDEHVGKSLIADISKYLTKIDRRILTVNSFVPDVYTPKRRDDHTGSVWHHIKDAFSHSKNNLVQYFEHKLKPKSYIVNEKVRKRVEEVNKQKFLKVMKKWQNHFDTYRPRSKRSVKHYPIRMKNIIPKYLRGIKANKTLNSKGKENSLNKQESKSQVIYKMPTKSNKSAVTRRNPVHSTRPPSTKHLGSSSRPIQVQKSHHPVLAQKVKKVERLSSRPPPVQHVKGQPKRGVRNQHIRH